MYRLNIFAAGVLTGLLLAAMAAPSAAAADVADSTAVTLLTHPLPDTPGFHVLKGVARLDGKQVPFATGIFLPRAWFESARPLPLVITLHNRGLNGANGSTIAFEGLAQLLVRDERDSRHTGEWPAHPVHLRDDAQFVALIPQCPDGFGWESPAIAPMLHRLIGLVCNGYHLDRQRVCLTGFSYGASSTWALAMELPDDFSAIAPIAGRHTPDPPHDVLKLKNVAIYLAIGGNDQSIPGETQLMHQALLDAGHSPMQFKVIPGGSHWSYGDIYLDANFWDWMLSQRRGPHPTTLPIVQTHYPVYPPLTPVATSGAPAGHGILWQSWRDIAGTQLRDLRDDPSFPRYPSEQRVLPTLQIPRNQPPNFGTCLRGWLCPSLSGNYRFFLASDDQGQLLLSSDDQPQHLRPIAEVTRWCWPDDWAQMPQQQSEAIPLLAGRRYYLEALQKDGGGDNHLSVAWKPPAATQPALIPAENLVPAPPAEVPPPRYVEMRPVAPPTEPGVHRLQLTVEYRAHRRQVPVLLLLPRHVSDSPPPCLLYCPDPDRRDATGFAPLAGPVAALAGTSPSDAAMADWSPFAVIVPQSPPGTNWDAPAILRSVAVVVDHLLHTLRIDATRVYLTGSNAGGTNAWRLATRLPGRFAVVAPINAMEIGGPNLSAALSGTAVHIITGVKNGVATDCANRMKTKLAHLFPPPDIVYEMNMGDEAADHYYHSRDFYQWLLTWSRPTGQVAVQTPQATTPGQ